jgi:hypothetical protein
MIENYGEPTSEKCPKCGGQILSNGNLFCENWTYPYEGVEDTCDWALPHPQETLVDKQISFRVSGYWEEETVDQWITHREEPE